jgi:hypothetical protein
MSMERDGVVPEVRKYACVRNRERGYDQSRTEKQHGERSHADPALQGERCNRYEDGKCKQLHGNRECRGCACGGRSEESPAPEPQSSGGDRNERQRDRRDVRLYTRGVCRKRRCGDDERGRSRAETACERAADEERGDDADERDDEHADPNSFDRATGEEGDESQEDVKTRRLGCKDIRAELGAVPQCVETCEIDAFVVARSIVEILREEKRRDSDDAREDRDVAVTC